MSSFRYSGWLLLSIGAWSAALARGAPGEVQRLEATYADFNDAYGAVSLMDSDPASYPKLYEGRSRATWQEIYSEKRSEILADLPRVRSTGMSAGDARAVLLMRAAAADSAATPNSPAPVGKCRDAQQQRIELQALQDALYACFAEYANHLLFEGGAITRVAAFDLLTQMPEAQRRKSLFMAFQPLWHALNGHGETLSPYRRMIKMAAASSRDKDSPIDAASRTIGISTIATEQWLERILDQWRRVSGDEAVEPWDYRFREGAAERELGGKIPREALQPLSERYYADLGLDLSGSSVIFDLNPRTDKAPLAYTDFVRRGRMIDGAWRPTLARVSASYEHGGLGSLNELVHEEGHAAHMLALRTRPAFMDLGDAIFYEALADVPSWSVYEPAWQQKYLGIGASNAASLRALYSGVMLDVAWALFDLRMLRDPQADPNLVWTAITTRYLHIKPHPDLAWWAVRVQLVDAPGYMVNYGLGAVITADLRQRITRQLGPFQTGDPLWFGWISENLLKGGEEQETTALLRQFLGRPPSPQALIQELDRVKSR
jgi:hypothetical protein